MSLDSRLQQIWYGKSTLALLLAPLSWLFRLALLMRRFAFRIGLLRSFRVSKPVIVVGNITVGGTGKTPLVLWLAKALQDAGHCVGIVMRGYGADHSVVLRDVHADSDPLEAGDEAVLVARKSNAIVVVCRDRVAAARRAIERGASIIVSDDGLQHYALARDVEIAVVDRSRALGNGLLLPAGPLREPAMRLQSVDVVAVNMRESPPQAPHFEYQAAESKQAVIHYRLHIEGVQSLLTGELRSLASFGQTPVHAIAGIGNPAAFFASLRTAGLDVDAHALPDHAAIGISDVAFGDRAPVLMTEKDAVKCQAFADERMWSVAVQVSMSESDAQRLLDVVNAVRTVA